MKYSGHWLTGLAIILLVLSICFNIGRIEVNDVSIVLAFIGVLATFVVVSNYAQVQGLENKLKSVDKEFKNQRNTLYFMKADNARSFAHSNMREIEFQPQHKVALLTHSFYWWCLALHNYNNAKSSNGVVLAVNNMKHIFSLLEKNSENDFYNLYNEFYPDQDFQFMINRISDVGDTGVSEIKNRLISIKNDAEREQGAG